MHKLEQIVSNNILQHNLLNHHDLIIVALSGGADSVALLAILKSLGYNCIAAHCNFHLRGEESNRDESHAINISKELDINCITTHFNVDEYKKANGVSTEMACRDLRYQWFESLRKKYNAQAIAVAHHRDDDIETMFLNLLRGSGITGVAAMKWKNSHIIRPMLNISRQEIEAYLHDKKLTFVIDSTNLTDEFKRNKLRNEVLPVLRDAFPNADEILMKSLHNLKENRLIYNNAIDNAIAKYKNGNIIYLSDIISEYIAPSTLLFEILNPLGFNIFQINDIINTSNDSGRKFFSQEWVAIVNRGNIQLSEISHFNNTSEYKFYISSENNNFKIESENTLPITLDIQELGCENFIPRNNSFEIYLDISAFEGNPQFILRHWKKGDRLEPFGMKGSKKVSDIFNDSKLSIIDKNSTWILERNGVILWIVGIRASRHFPVSSKTKRIMCVKASF